MGVAAGILLQSCIRAERHIISYLYFRLMSAIFDLRHTQTSNIIIIFIACFYGTENVLLPLKLCCYHVLADKRVITLFQPPSWISDFRFHLGVLLIAPLKRLTLKHGGSRWNFVPI